MRTELATLALGVGALAASAETCTPLDTSTFAGLVTGGRFTMHPFRAPARRRASRSSAVTVTTNGTP